MPDSARFKWNPNLEGVAAQEGTARKREFSDTLFGDYTEAGRKPLSTIVTTGTVSSDTTREILDAHHYRLR